MAPARTAGISTFLVSDFAEAVRLRATAPEALAQAAGGHRQIVARAAAAHDGIEVASTGGSAASAAFRRPVDAVVAALEARRAMRAVRWPRNVDLRVRMAVHTTSVSPDLGAAGWEAPLRRCARLAALAPADQVLLCARTHELAVGDWRLGGAGLRDVGVHRLPDLAHREHVYELVDPDRPRIPGGLRSLDTLPNNLPGELLTFVGRERELADVGRIADAARLLTLTGVGGCGKTRLALQAAADMLERLPGGVWWVDLAPVESPAEVGQALADALGVRPLPGSTPLQAAVAHLMSRRALVLLDNCEHLREGAAQAAEALLSGCPDVTVLATSRAPLGLPAETTWRVPSLSLADRDAGRAGARAASDAARLFAERARRVRPDFAVEAASAPALERVCAELDGNPLAIELAAANVGVLSLAQIADGLEDRFRLLTGGAPAALPRHRTLRASVDWSHELLAGDERALFRRLAVFAGGFTLKACEAVCPADADERGRVIDVLGSLVDHSLVVVEERGPEVRYRLPKTVRAYAHERLRAAGELDAVRDRHRGFFLALAERAAPELQSARARAALDALDADAANLDAALESAIETDGEQALRLCAALSLWWRMRGIFVAADACCARALDAADAGPSKLRARVLWARAYLLTYGGRFEEARATAQAALDVAEALADPAETAWALEALSRVGFVADPVGCRPALERAADLARQTGEDLCLVTSLQSLAWGHLICGELDAAEAALREGFAVVERRGFREPLAWHWLALSHRPMHAGDSERFFALAERAIGAAREIGDPMTEGFTHGHCAIVELAQGRTRAAVDRLTASRERSIASGAGMALMLTEFVLGAAEATLGDFDAARGRIEMVVATRADDGALLGWAMAQLADVLRVAGDSAGAETWARKALALNERVKTPHGISWCKEVLGRLAAERGEWGDAATLLHESLAIRAERGMRRALPQALDALAEVAVGLSAPEEAARLLGAAARGRSDLGYVRWAPDEPRAEALERELRAEMGDDAFAAAWSEGTGLALEDAVAWIRRARGSRKRPPGGWESLTPTELEVARRAADGMTNTEIGEAMFITAGTVKTHLSHIYAKLGVRNRTQLTAAAARRLAAPAQSALR